ncbi:MAG: IclR family transcriptional regulator, partial [Leifsonia sp.]|uniref:IclR family transcriptional regulator n=1 Tax=Leifsonia sp. TaxID=1870902 RepID=UPI003F7D1D9F
MASPSDDAPAPHSQTLSRGIRVLEVLADAERPLTIAELAAALGVHRSIVYRILRTLEDHGLVVRNAAGAAQLGPRMATLARSVSRSLQSAALPQLSAVANELSMTAFLAVLDRHEVVTLVSIEPANAHASVAQRPGTRHPLASGAPGIAIQSALTEEQWSELPDEHPRDEAATARRLGYATSHDEVIPGIASVAVPLVVHGQPLASIAVVYVASDRDTAAVGGRPAGGGPPGGAAPGGEPPGRGAAG